MEEARLIDQNLKRLKNERRHFKAELTCLETFLKKIDISDIPFENIRIRCDTIKPLLTKFQNVQFEIEQIYIDNFSDQFDEQEANVEYTNFEIKYYETVAMCQRFLSQLQPSVNENCNLRHSSNGSAESLVELASSARPKTTAKLPSLKLPEFTGVYGDWQGFFDTFHALIHENKNLSNVEKFYYLQASLKGEAANVIASLPISSTNYSTAWSLLKKRYENKKVIITSHLREIMNLQCTTKQSHSSLRQFSNTFLKNYRSLEALGENVIEWDTILLFILTEKLDSLSRKEWEIHSTVVETPNVNDLMEFITQRCQILEAIDDKAITNLRKPHSSSSFLNTGTRENKQLCPFCKASHYIYLCDKFKALSVNSRYSEVKRLRLCTNCLRLGHKYTDCRSGSCKICRQRHATILHFPSNQNRPCHNDQEPGTNSQDTLPANTGGDSINSSNDNIAHQYPQTQHTVLSNYYKKSSTSIILLSTAIVNAYDKNGNPIPCRLILDSGSQSNFVTKSFLNVLQINTNTVNIPVAGINQTSTNITERARISISSQHTNFKTELNFLVLPAITSRIPQDTFDISNLEIPSELNLADNFFNVSSNVDMLLGCEIFFELLCIGQIKLGKHLPILQKTLLGWIISGNLSADQKTRFQTAMMTNCLFSDVNLERFWSTEEIMSTSQTFMTKEELECENLFSQTTRRDESGRFIVQLPLKENYVNLGMSEQTALNRFYSLERRLRNNPELKISYTSFMKEYQDLGHMSEISRDSVSKTPVYYIPHHCVEKPDSTTTKVRVVFDASCKSSSNLSLNDTLKVGPTVQTDLFSILTRFRQHDVVLIADLSKFYRQILIDANQRNLQRIVWRSSTDEQIKHFQLNTVTYGTAPASFLATRCLKQIAIENSKVSFEESRIIASDFYVDDLLTGATDPALLINIRKNICNILNRYGLELRKFQSNDSRILQDLKLNVNSNTPFIISDDSTTKTLGICWIPSLDIFEYNTHLISNNFKPTKRTILSFIAKLFDPLGLLGPILIRAKITIQQLWQLQIDWDETLPSHLHSDWLKLYYEISHIGSIHIPRQAVVKSAKYIQIHGFADASEVAYACCIYLRSIDSNNHIKTNLLCAKSRVAPLKTLSIPRLELCGALLLTKLLSKCLDALTINIDQIFLWSDSTIVLSWINAEPRNWKVFVANRVSEIQRLSKTKDWNHITSEINPADIISRGAKLADLSHYKLWWHGPPFLNLHHDQWPLQNYCWKSTRGIPESKTISLATAVNPKFDILNKFSSLTRLINVFTYCLRFMNNTRTNQSNKKFTGNLHFEETQIATMKLIKLVQLESFEDELQSLKNNKCISSRSKLKLLDPFLDEKGVIRVGGRLTNSDLPYDAKHPIVLPKKHTFTQLVIHHEHIRTLHAGIQTTLSHVRQKYWPINSRQCVKSCVKKCITCFRANPTTVEPKMGNLPKLRVTPARPFLSVSLDYAGPFDLKDGKTRTTKIIKGYICIFVCLATKAVHLELICDLTSDGLLSLLKRFFSRRGICTDIISDNAPNFVGANNTLKSLQNLLDCSKMKNYLLQSNIQWHFIPSRSPHFGGLHESAVKSCKHHLKRILNNIHLNYEEFYTLITQIEAIMNSRPLFPLSTDPNDLEAITPAHFLIGHPLTALPERDLTNTPINRIKRYQHLQKMGQHFWSRWVKEYLHHLQQRTKWQFNQKHEIKLGALVLLHENNVPSMQWSLGRILEVHPGKDGIIRAVSVKTRTGIVKRAVVKVSLLPID